MLAKLNLALLLSVCLLAYSFGPTVVSQQPAAEGGAEQADAAQDAVADPAARVSFDEDKDFVVKSKTAGVLARLTTTTVTAPRAGSAQARATMDVEFPPDPPLRLMLTSAAVPASTAVLSCCSSMPTRRTSLHRSLRTAPDCTITSGVQICQPAISLGPSNLVVGSVFTYLERYTKA